METSAAMFYYKQKKILDEVAVGSRCVLFEVKIFIYLQEQFNIRVTTSDDQIYFLFFVNIENIKNRPPATFPPTHGSPTQRFIESLFIFEFLDSRNIFILQNTNKAGKSYKLYFGVLSQASIGFHKAHAEESVIYIFQF